MSNVLVKDRKTAETQYLTTAREVRLAVTRLVSNEKVVPKRYKFVYTIPTIDKCRKLLDSAYIYENCKQFDDKSDFIYNRKKQALLDMLDCCDQIFCELACIKSQFYVKMGPYERVVAMIVDEERLIKYELEKITKDS